MDKQIKKIKWNRVSSISNSRIMLPPSSGIYAIGEVKTEEDLPTEIKWVYIGKSKNLRKRILNHLPQTEENPNLSSYLQLKVGVNELWYAVVEESLTNDLEKKLIRKLQPRFNRITYKRKGQK